MEIMSNLECFVQELRNSLPEPKLKPRPVVQRDVDALYNIHKRSIPVSLDKPIVIGLTRTEADLEVVKLIQKEAKRRVAQIIDEPETKVFFYFDIIPCEPLPEERSVYYNEGSPVL